MHSNLGCHLITTRGPFIASRLGALLGFLHAPKQASALPSVVALALESVKINKSMKHGGNSTRQVVSTEASGKESVAPQRKNRNFIKAMEKMQQNPWKMPKSCLHLRSWFQTSAWRTVASKALWFRDSICKIYHGAETFLLHMLLITLQKYPMAPFCNRKKKLPKAYGSWWLQRRSLRMHAWILWRLHYSTVWWKKSCTKYVKYRVLSLFAGFYTSQEGAGFLNHQQYHL